MLVLDGDQELDQPVPLELALTMPDFVGSVRRFLRFSFSDFVDNPWPVTHTSP